MNPEQIFEQIKLNTIEIVFDQKNNIKAKNGTSKFIITKVRAKI